jgi:hypothetical protein
MKESMFGSHPFIEGHLALKPDPLSHYLPPVPRGVVSNWLTKNAPQGSWILDPFGSSPSIIIEGARVGYRILVSINNPINRFILEILANPPQVDELKAALSELSASFLGSERVELHILSLYNTVCANCGQTISAEAFIWEHGNPAPYLRIYTCPHCGDTGEHPCTANDVELAGRFSSSGLHKARALERVVAANDPDRIHVEQALSVYPPRALYALITIMNKLEGLNISPAGRKYLSALLLYAFDVTTAMWRDSSQKERRRQLTLPHNFRENNVWYALEEGIKIWSAPDSQKLKPTIPLSIWPELPPASGGICIYEGRFLSLAESIKNLHIDDVCTVIPRPNQAFWTLSALWAGWLWGREAVASFKSVLHRQRYDWSWHTTALSSVFKQLTTSLKPSTSIFGLLSEAEPGYIASALIAAGISGCQLESMAIRSELEQAQIIWKCAKIPEQNLSDSDRQKAAIQAAKKYLELRAEPASYLNTISAAIIGILGLWNFQVDGINTQTGNQPSFSIVENKVDETPEPSPSSVYQSIFNSARESLSYRNGFLQYNLQDGVSTEANTKSQSTQSSLFSLNSSTIDENSESEASENATSESEPSTQKGKPLRSSDIPLSTLIWLREPVNAQDVPITDRIELSLVSHLIKLQRCTIEEIHTALCEKYSGLFTPPVEFIQLCLESYIALGSREVNHLYLRLEDMPDARRAAMDQAESFIFRLGERLGFRSEQCKSDQKSTFIAWLDNAGQPEYRLFLTPYAAIGNIVLHGNQPNGKNILVIPGSRANILFYKLRRDPRLSKAFNPTQGNWRFLKLRHLRSIVESPNLFRDNLDQLLSLDPITYSTPQLWLI